MEKKLIHNKMNNNIFAPYGISAPKNTFNGYKCICTCCRYTCRYTLTGLFYA